MIPWDPQGAPAGPVPWARIETSLRLVHRWADPHLLIQRVAQQPRRAAVAVLLWGGPDGARQVVVVRRGASAPEHGGELAFPGGMEEACDRDLPATARRELAEELGVTSHLWELGCFPDMVAKSRTRFTPVFLRWEAPAPEFHLGSEIQDVLMLPLEGLFTAPWTTRTFAHEGVSFETPWLDLAQAPLWGATARVLKSWLDLLSSVPSP